MFEIDQIVFLALRFLALWENISAVSSPHFWRCRFGARTCSVYYSWNLNSKHFKTLYILLMSGFYVLNFGRHFVQNIQAALKPCGF